jgi:hypothetical protein
MSNGSGSLLAGLMVSPLLPPTPMAKQTSNKAGVKSLSKKAQNSRHGFDPHPAAGPVAGATGQEPRRGRKTQAGTATAQTGKGAALSAQQTRKRSTAK